MIDSLKKAKEKINQFAFVNFEELDTEEVILLDKQSYNEAFLVFSQSLKYFANIPNVCVDIQDSKEEKKPDGKYLAKKYRDRRDHFGFVGVNKEGVEVRSLRFILKQS